MTEQLLEAKKAYKDKDYERAYELFTSLYGKIPFDNSSKYSYAWSVYHTKVKDFTSREDLLKSADLITDLTRQNNLNHAKTCVYTRSVFRVLKLLYHESDYESLPYWLDKINPDYLDQVRPMRDDKVYPSNMETYYTYASVTYFKLAEYEECISVSRDALTKLNRFTNNSFEFFQWRIAKSYRRIGECEESLKFLKIIQLDEWYVYHEIAEDYYCLKDSKNSLEYALKAAVKDGASDMKYNLYVLLSKLLADDYPEVASKHELLCDYILEDDPLKGDLESELMEFWKGF